MAVTTTERVSGEVTTSLQEQEAIIEKGLGSFREVGEALGRIRDSGLYKEEFDTFEQYVKTRWGISYAYAKDQVNASRVVKELETSGITEVPANLEQARPLIKVLNQRDSKAVVESWKEVLARNAKTNGSAEKPKPITGKDVSKVVNPPVSSGKPGWFEMLGSVADDLQAAQKHLTLVESAVAVAANRAKPKTPKQEFLDRAAEYAELAEDVHTRLISLSEGEQ